MVSERTRGIGLAAAGMAVLSTDSLLIRAAETDPMDVVFWVGSFTAVVMLSIAGRLKRRTPTTVLYWHRAAIIAATFQATTVVCFVLAVETTNVANVLVILATVPFVSAILAWLLLREATAPRTWIGALLSAGGIAVIVLGSFAGGSAVGDLYAGAAVVAFASLTVWMRRHPAISGPFVIGLAGLGMAVVASPWATLDHSSNTWLALASMGLLTAPMARLMLATAPRYIPATDVALLAPVETVLGSAWAFIAFSERPSWQTLIGGGVILAGVLFGLAPSRDQWLDADDRRRMPEFR